MRRHDEGTSIGREVTSYVMQLERKRYTRATSDEEAAPALSNILTQCTRSHLMRCCVLRTMAEVQRENMPGAGDSGQRLRNREGVV